MITWVESTALHFKRLDNLFQIDNIQKIFFIFQHPHYYLKITRPMDLSTIDKRVKNSSYSTVAAFRRDVELILDNSVTFNGPPERHPITRKAQEIVHAARTLLNDVVTEMVFRGGLTPSAYNLTPPPPPSAKNLPIYRFLAKMEKFSDLNLPPLQKICSYNLYVC